MAVQYGFSQVITSGLALSVDVADPTSYTSGSTTWFDITSNRNSGSITGSVGYSSNFKGSLVFSNPTSSVIFPTTVANYSTGSFTVEMAFRPSQINGRHYLASKNSGSFPYWGIYLSGSNGTGKLWAEYIVSSSISCSVSSSTLFNVDSNYFIDVTFYPGGKFIFLSTQGQYDNISIPASNTGSLSSTANLFLANTSTSSSLNYSGSLFSTKIYSTEVNGFINFKSIAARLNQKVTTRPSKAIALVVGGGGGGNRDVTGGGGATGAGGAGGLVLTNFNLISGSYIIQVGTGSVVDSSNMVNGQNSILGNIVAFGGGGGGTWEYAGLSGGSGGGPRGAGIINQGTSGSNISQGGGGGGFLSPGSGSVGGSGVLLNITGTPTIYAKGGSAVTSPVDSIPNTGNGGDGDLNSIFVSNNKKQGASGIVVIRYPGPPIATGGTINSFQGDTIHTFTATGSSTFTVF